MARKIVYKKSGLNSQPTTPNGYKFVGYDNDTFSEKDGDIITPIGAEGGGGNIFIERSLPDLHTDISNNELVPGATYKITGVHKAHTIDDFPLPISALYDDGRDLGTTIFLKAISENELETFGSGIFYNPKYDKQVQGFGIWSNNAPNYNADDIVFWGGYAWKNLSGNIGTDTDILNLNGEWEKLNYDDENYNKVVDYIEYDIENDLITRRYDTVNDIDVNSGLYEIVLLSMALGLDSTPVSLMQWGNDLSLDFSIGSIVGVGKISVKNSSIADLINFKGQYISNATFDNGSLFMNVTFDNGSWLRGVTLNNGASLNNVTFDNRSYLNNVTFENVTFDTGVSLGNVTFDNQSYFDNVTLNNQSSLTNVSLNRSYLQNVTLDNESRLENVTLVNELRVGRITVDIESYLQNVTLDNGSNLQNVTFVGSRLENATLVNESRLENVTLVIESSLENATLNGSELRNVTLENSSMIYNTFINFRADFNHQTYSNLNIPNIKFEGIGNDFYTMPDISMATIITDQNIPQKKVFGIDSTTIKIQYWDSVSNDFVVADITGPALNFDITANWDLTKSPGGESRPVTDEDSFIQFLTSNNITDIIVTDFNLDNGRLTCNLSASGENLTMYNIEMTEFNGCGNITGLSDLNLNNNQLTEFNPSIALPDGLKHLYLNGNPLTSFDPSIAALPTGLSSLNFTNTQLTSFDPSIPLPTGLMYLNFNNSQLTSFDPSIALPNGLYELTLTGNQLTEFNPSIALPTGLQSLYLTRNQLTEFNPTIALPIGLRVLYLNDNQITTAGWEISAAWATLQDDFISCEINCRQNIDPVTGTTFESILTNKNCTIRA